MHVVQIIRSRVRPRLRVRIPLMPGELHAVGVDIEGSGFLSEGGVDMKVGLGAGVIGAQTDRSQVVEGEVVALAGSQVAGEEEAVAVDEVLGDAPGAAGVEEVTQDFAVEAT